jgi:hypothetical protein
VWIRKNVCAASKTGLAGITLIRKQRKQKKEDEGENMKQMMNKLLIVDHNFTTIFRQPDGSAG